MQKAKLYIAPYNIEVQMKKQVLRWLLVLVSTLATNCETVEKELKASDGYSASDSFEAEHNNYSGSSKIPTKQECKDVLDSFGASFLFVNHAEIPLAVRMFTLGHGVQMQENDLAGTGDLLTSCVVAVALVRAVHDLYVKGYIITRLSHKKSYKPGDKVLGRNYPSEHANGMAIDIVDVRNGPKTYSVKSDYDTAIIQALRASLKKFFEVVLDKENDPVDHSDHFHATRPISAPIGKPLGSSSAEPPKNIEQKCSILVENMPFDMTVGDKHNLCWSYNGACQDKINIHLYLNDKHIGSIVTNWPIGNKCIEFEAHAGLATGGMNKYKIGVSTVDESSYAYSNIFRIWEKKEKAPPSSNNNGKLQLCHPFKDQSITVKYGFGSYKGHYGSDYPASKETKIFAPANGIVVKTDDNINGQICTKNANGHYSPGNFVKIRQGIYDILLFHMTKDIKVKKDDSVSMGYLLGFVSNTGRTMNSKMVCGVGGGYHLHLEVRKKNPANEEYVAFDPYNSNDVEWVTCTYDGLEISSYKEDDKDGVGGGGKPIDNDNDGFDDVVDCDDKNPKVYPNAKELCNGIDDNCDGKTDENHPAVGSWCYDGYGVCRVTSTTICSPNGISLICPVSAKQPTSAEICGNGLDDDCDDETDEGCVKKPVDNDKDGFDDIVDCDDNNDKVYPNAKELCNGIDDNCDGKTDENYLAVGSWCYDGYGVCKKIGVYTCAKNKTSLACSVTAGTPGKEICGNGLDDDCDGETDEDCELKPENKNVKCPSVKLLTCNKEFEINMATEPNAFNKIDTYECWSPVGANTLNVKLSAPEVVIAPDAPVETKFSLQIMTTGKGVLAARLHGSCNPVEGTTKVSAYNKEAKLTGTCAKFGVISVSGGIVGQHDYVVLDAVSAKTVTVKFICVMP